LLAEQADTEVSYKPTDLCERGQYHVHAGRHAIASGVLALADGPVRRAQEVLVAERGDAARDLVRVGKVDPLVVLVNKLAGLGDGVVGDVDVLLGAPPEPQTTAAGIATALPLAVLDDVFDLGVGDVAGRVSAGTCGGARGGSHERTLRPRTAGLGHLEGATVAGDTGEDLVGWDAGLGDHGQRVERLGHVDVRAQAVAVLERAAGRGPLVAVVPLAVQVVGHVDHVVNEGLHLAKREALEVPLRRRHRDSQRLAGGQLGAHHLEELHHVVGKRLAVGRRHALPEDGVRVGVGRERPAAEREDALEALDAHKLISLPLGLAQVDLEVLGDLAKSKVHVRVLGRDLADVHVKARARGVPRLEVTQVHELGRLFLVVENVGTAFGDAGVLLVARVPRQLARGLGARAEVGRGAALAPDVAAGVERAGVHLGHVLAGVGLPRAPLLRAADGVAERVWRLRRAFGDAHADAHLRRDVARPAPDLLVERL